MRTDRLSVSYFRKMTEPPDGMSDLCQRLSFNGKSGRRSPDIIAIVGPVLQNHRIAGGARDRPAADWL